MTQDTNTASGATTIALIEALERARNGLQWYQDAYPEAGSGADDEMLAEIDAALASAAAQSADCGNTPYDEGSFTLAQPAEGAAYAELPDVDALAQEIRRVDGANKLGAGALAEALMPFLRASHGQAPAVTAGDREKWEQQVNDLIDEYGDELATEACHGELHCRQSPARIREQIRVLLSTPTAQPAPAPTPQADSQPAPDERDDFEKVFPLPSGCIRVGTGYASTGYSNWAAHTHCERRQGWQARAARAPADSVAAPAGGETVTDDMVLAALRVQYPAAYGQYLRHPANGPKTSLRTESEIDTARRMIVAALAAQAADSVLEDAARYRWLRINAIGAFRTNDGKGPVSVYHLSKIPAIPGIPEETDAAIDAAMAAKKGDTHE